MVAPRPEGERIADAMLEFADPSGSEVAGVRFPSDFEIPPLEVLTPLGLALAAERSRQAAALEKLRKALQSGVLAGRGFFPGDRERSEIPPEWWRGASLDPLNSSAKAREVVVQDVVVYSPFTNDLDEEIGPTSAKAEGKRPAVKGKGGRPPMHDWVAFMKEVVRFAVLDGFDTRKQLTEHMKEWCGRQWPNPPDSETIRRKVIEIWPDGMPAE